MPSALPEGEPVPDDGSLPPDALSGASGRPLAFYLHVPYCATRCGYCDFNTYTAGELRGSGGVLASRENYADTLIDEIRLARKVLGEDPRPVESVFVGGGTPTLLPAADLGRMLAAIRAEFPLADDAEITTEANPDSVDPRYLAQLRAAGFNRVSFGMQSARQHVLRVLDRTHTPGRPEACVAEARAAGFDHVNLDLIYGTPGESDDDWRASLTAAVEAGPDHVSAYALIVEEGTRLAHRIRRGEVPATDDDVHADRYLIAEELLASAGFDWYEVSNWATSEAGRCRHNLLYWTGADWWGAGPGAHSHVGGVRWWNVKHPAAYAAALARGHSPGAGREVLQAEDRRVERVLLELRLADGCPLDLLRPAGAEAARRAVADGLLDADAHASGRAALTLRGRLLADALVRDLVD
ncbi:radical SAM family heme chaperone HemW [Streptomyces alkaliterrae]|uniref:Heme chaperone HemW n=1 Tax=Streptomyces alkaliterrae TaxID=2213162 RepID=A0A5P0YJ38_9ACTN|nr:radical SAM family heme chaperone HemW [Streptomyces alkaliterrae]MBB1251989.1 coproporphyrinogen III oxidase [Streptomyces alkaliterrae]MBB1257506.1 coproporphyrinogen III oxidase [Streptomyces alkaliterrae]MQS00394.1 coproporphyrinogen III oxidase [Streptomyces alkaliterrae]